MANQTCPLRSNTRYYCSSDCAWYSEKIQGCVMTDKDLHISGLESLLEKLDEVIEIQKETAKGFKKVSTLAKKKTKGK